MPTLPPADIEAFARDGIVAAYPVLDDAEREAALETIALMKSQPDSIRGGLLMHKSHLVSRRLADICRKPAITDRVAALIGPDLLVWGGGFFIKEAHSPTYVSWHQDATYWGLEPADIVTAWVALTPSTHESGCLRVVPGSHTWPIMAHRETFAEGNLLSRGQEIAIDVDEATTREIPLAQGEMSIHHVKIAHNSEPNRADHARIGFAIRYVATHVRPAARDGAMLARGTDTVGNFEPEEGGRGELSPADLAHHATSLQADRVRPR